MSTVAAPTASDRALARIGALAATALALLLVAPRTSPGVLALLLLAIGLAGGLAAGLPQLRRTPLPIALLLGLAAWGLISTIWAADRGEAVSKSLLLATLVVAASWAMLAVRHTQARLLQRLAVAALVAYGAGVAWLCIEEMTGHALKRLLFLALPFARPDPRHITDVQDTFVLNHYISNRNIAAMTLALWPMLLIALTVVGRARRVPAAAGLLVLAVATMALSIHDTSLIALVAALVVLAVTMAWPKLGLCMVAAGWVMATLLVVPVASWALHGARLQEAGWLPHSARHRIVLWGYTADQVQSRPLLGVGAASTKLIDTRRGPAYQRYPGTSFEWRTGPHAHNVFLQTWYELGAVGAVLLCAAGLALVAALSRLPPPALPLAAAGMAASAVMAAFTWGMWQAWFLGAFAVSAVLMAVAVQLVRADGSIAANDAA